MKLKHNPLEASSGVRTIVFNENYTQKSGQRIIIGILQLALTIICSSNFQSSVPPHGKIIRRATGEM